MRRWARMGLAALLALLMMPAVLAEGVSLRTASAFAGEDAAAVAYVELLQAYEAETSNTVADVSATSDEGWKAGVLADFAAGNEPDVLFFFACSADSAPILRKMVPIREINAAFPDLNLPESEILRESDGEIYAIPVRPYYEGLFVNTELFEQLGLSLPDSWAGLEAAVKAFRAAGITPIAASLSDIPHYLAECAILACATREEYDRRPGSVDEVPQSWLDGMALIRTLYEMGAFPEDALNTSETITSQMFREGQAAMQIDGSWFANTLPEAAMDTVRVLPMPANSGEGGLVIGGVSMGFYLTRRAWEDPERREAAARLLGWLTAPGNIERLGSQQVTGTLEASAQTLLDDAAAVLRPIQDDMNKEARETWLLECVPAVAEGRMTPEECWARVMALHPFEE